MSRADRQLLCLLAALPAGLLLSCLLGLRVLYYRDIAIVTEPHVAFFRNSLWSGQLPLWNPLLAGGFPQWASLEPSCLYPPNILFFYLRVPFSLTLLLYLHLAAAGWGMNALGRALGWLRPAALVAAFSYALGGYVVSSYCYYSLLVFCALLPLAGLAFHRQCARPGPHRLLALALAITGLVAAARPDLMLMALFFLGVYALYLGYRRRQRAYLPLAWLGGAVLLALLANAAAVLPAAELIRYSNRVAGLEPAEAYMNSISPLAMVQLVFPWCFGNSEWDRDWGRFFVGEPSLGFAQQYLSLYPGMAAYLFAGYALLIRRRLLDYLLAGGALLGILAALGKWGFLFAWLHHLPLFAQVRDPGKYMLLFAWSMAWLAGRGADTWLRRRAVAGRYCSACLALAGAGLAGVGWLYLSPATWTEVLIGMNWSPWLTGPPNLELRDFLTRQLATEWPAVLAAIALPLALLAALAALVTRRDRPHTVRLVLALAAADLLLQAWPVFFTAAPGFFAATPAAVARMEARAGPGTLFRYQRLDDPTAPAANPRQLAAFLHWQAAGRTSWQEQLYHWARQILASLTPVSFGLAATMPSPSGLMPALSVSNLLADVNGLFADRPDSPVPFALAGLFNVGFHEFVQVPVLAPPRAGRQPLLQLDYRDPATGVFLYRNATFRPRAFFTSSAIVAPTREHAARILTDPAQPWHGQVVLARDQALVATLPLRNAGRKHAPGITPRCTVLSYANQRIELALETPQSGFVVLSDNLYPGWRVEVDGEPRPLLQANIVVRAVWVEAGRHAVVFRFVPVFWLVGCAISMLTLLGLGLAGLRSRGDRP